MDIELFKKRLYILYVLLPLIAIGIFCLRYNQNIFNYFLPNSQWNDELIYYKTIEGITEYGIPQGYFGYNESRASIGTFGAWSPIIYMFDAIWGGVFGWNLYSPIIVRIVFACIGMLIYAALVRPNVRNSLFIWLFVISFSLYARYLSSQMADCYMVTLLVIYAGLYNRKEKKYKMAGRIVLVLLTLLRPYYVLLWLPVLDSSENEKYIIRDIIIAGGSLAGYFAISYYFTASYFTSLIKFDWLKLILESPSEGVSNFFGILYEAAKVIGSSITSAFVDGNDVGLQYFLYLILTLCFLFMSLMHKEKRKGWLCWFVVNIMFCLTIVLFYDVRVGSRHLMPFIIMEGFIILGQNKGYYIKSLFVVLVFYLCLMKFTDPYFTTYPSGNEILQAQISEMRNELADKIEIDETDRWNNTVIWVLSDTDGAYPWQTLYSLPAGMGISICSYDYVTSEFGSLRSKYIACTANGDVDRLCRLNGYLSIYSMEDSNVCVYMRQK